MMKEKENKQNRRPAIENALEKKSEPASAVKPPAGGTKKQSRLAKLKEIDWFRLMFRGVMSVMAAFLVSGVGAGIIEAGTGREIDFGSPMMIGLVFASFVAFWTLFTFIGPYKSDD